MVLNLVCLLKRITLILTCCLLLTCTPSPYSQYKVLNTAESDTSQNILNVESHLRFTERPQDQFQYPIALGEVGPTQMLFAGPNRYPFSCDTLRSGLGEPIVDNQEVLGTAVFKDEGRGKKRIGYSKDCLAKTRLRHFIVNRKGESKEILKPEELATYANSEWQLLRLEQGTINRYIYTIAMPIKHDEFNQRLKKSQWNNKLIYQFAGGVGIGFRQGKVNPKKLLSRRYQQFFDGYAVITSSANKTSYTYNMLIAEDTAWRVKRQFIALYGEPEYTVGIGGSGGGLAQYLLAQNSPGLIDAAIPLYSYPDMVSQTIYALDCDLFNNYYHFKSSLENWDSIDKKRGIEGLNNAQIEHKSWFYTPLNQILTGQPLYRPKIYSECVHGYFGLSSLINNPAQGFLKPLFSQTINHQTKWSYWHDLSNVTGTANSLWDNEGVQYGLLALKQGTISIDEFLHLNFHIGGWKPQHMQRPEQLLFLPFIRTPLWLSQWSRHNVHFANDKPARRSIADLELVSSAYRFGQVYLGVNSIPTIDIHHYLEEQLDMHHVSTSFATRLRIAHFQQNTEQHKIWIADKNYTPLKEAFSVIDKWLVNKHIPESASDRCFDQNGEIIAAGHTVWDDKWNNKSQGACAKAFPIYSNSRIQAGGPWRGSIFKCHRMSVAQALKRGLYSPHDLTAYRAQLEKTFPTGVCDYQQGDMGNPYLQATALIDKSNSLSSTPIQAAK